MNVRFSLIFVSVIALHCASASLIDEIARIGNDETERIIGGEDAEEGQFPWVCALHYNDRFICTCSIISGRDVLTAAHCVQFDGVNQDPGLFYAIANVDKSEDSVRLEFSDLDVHPGYGDGTIDNDIALFHTTETIETSDNVKPVCIARKDTRPLEYKNATAMGWGDTDRNPLESTIPDKLQYVCQAIIPNFICSFFIPGVNPEKICATGLFNGVCNGDSGGPLVHISEDKPPVEIGIASYLNALTGCGSTFPAVFTRVSSHHDWIMDNAEDPAGICKV